MIDLKWVNAIIFDLFEDSFVLDVFSVFFDIWLYFLDVLDIF